MKLICSVLLLAILEESYWFRTSKGKMTSSVNRTTTSWGYSYNLGDTRGFKVKHDDKGYHFEPFYNDTSSGLKKHYNSRSVYDQVTSSGANHDGESHSSTNDVINGTTNSRSSVTGNLSPVGDKVTNKVLFDKSANGITTTVPVTKTQTVTVTETRTEAPIATDKTSSEALSSSHNIPVGGINGSPSVSSNQRFYKTTFEAPYRPQNTPIYAAPTDPVYYPQAPSYGQMYGPAGSSMYDVTNGQLYGPPMGSMYGPPTGNPYVPTGPNYGVPTRSISWYAPQNGQMYGPPSGQIYVPQNGQTNGYPTGSLYGSNRNF